MDCEDGEIVSGIRNSAKGVILKNDQVLLIKNKSQYDEWYTLPGGGQNHKENLHDSLAREILEETGLTVEIGPLFAIREYIGANHEFAEYDQELHAVEFMFLCKVLSDNLQISIPDSHQVSVDWINISNLESVNLYPKAIIPVIKNYSEQAKMPQSLYLGDVN